MVSNLPPLTPHRSMNKDVYEEEARDSGAILYMSEHFDNKNENWLKYTIQYKV